MSYTELRHLADSWGLVAMGIVYLILCGWVLRPGARRRNDTAAHSIFKDSDHG